MSEPSLATRMAGREAALWSAIIILLAQEIARDPTSRVVMTDEFDKLNFTIGSILDRDGASDEAMLVKSRDFFSTVARKCSKNRQYNARGPATCTRATPVMVAAPARKVPLA
jgi:hypothetical protein